MIDISPRLLPLLEFVYTAVDDTSARASVAKGIASAVAAQWVVLRVAPTAHLPPSPPVAPGRLVGRWPAWEGADVEVVACRDDDATPFGDEECRIFAALVPHLARAARLGRWGEDCPLCLAATAWPSVAGV
jgi:hypothetical protein